MSKNSQDDKSSKNSVDGGENEKLGPRGGKRRGKGGKGSPNKLSQFSSKNGLWTWVLFGTAILLLVKIFNQANTASMHVDYSELKSKVVSGEIKRVLISKPDSVTGYTTAEPQAKGITQGSRGKVYVANFVDDPELMKLMDKHNVRYAAENMTMKNLFWWGLTILGFILLWRFLFARAFKMGPGAGLMSFGKNRAKLVEDDAKKVTFDDVAGVDEAKEELQEIISFLKTPQKFREIGGKIPKGILLVGPPGTGKTLIARAVAGQAGVPFFSLSGSEFVEMFVGVGASRVRDLFAQAQEKAPCIIFIDELDAIGKMRSSVSPMGGHDEREQTLNQLLVEMDGFDTRTGVIIMAATNRPEILDPALLRPGRFDRQVLIDRPDIVGRTAILKVHAKHIKCDEELDISVIAARTPGFVGADLANVCNEAALLAVRKGKKSVGRADFEDAVDRVVAGLQRKSRLINLKEKGIVAHHEVGHALATHFTRGTDPVHKISVIPRGFGALGFTLALPTEDRYLLTKEELVGRVDVLLGGRVAEEVIFDEISTGASDDLQKATDIAKQMVMDYGMSKKIGQRTFRVNRQNYLEGSAGSQTTSDYSDSTANELDAEIDKILSDAYSRVTKLITDKKDLLIHVAKVLQEKEVLEGDEFADMVKEFESNHSENKKKQQADQTKELGSSVASETTPPNVDGPVVN